MRYIITNITENGVGQLWSDQIEANTATAVREYIEQLDSEHDPHLRHAEKGGRFMVGSAASTGLATVAATTVRFYEVKPSPPVPKFQVSRV